MKAVLDRDIIVLISERAGTVDIGNKLPKNRGLECLRFDGHNIIDMSKRNSFWVEYTKSGAFVLHVIEVPRSQYVEMSYNDQKKLRMKNGHIHVATPQELEKEQQDKDKKNKNHQWLRRLDELEAVCEDHEKRIKKLEHK